MNICIYAYKKCSRYIIIIIQHKTKFSTSETVSLFEMKSNTIYFLLDTSNKAYKNRIFHQIASENLSNLYDFLLSSVRANLTTFYDDWYIYTIDLEV